MSQNKASAVVNSPDDLGTALGCAGEIFISQADATRELLRSASGSNERGLDLEWAQKGLSEEQREELYKDLDYLFAVAGKFLDETDETEVQAHSFSTDPAVQRALVRFMMRHSHKTRMPPKTLLLRRSMLLIAVSDFELLLGRVMYAVLIDKPELAGVEKASISFSELQELKDVAAAKELIIERNVDELLRKSLDEWVVWFEHVGVKWKDMVDDWVEFVEILGRRNIIVHAGETVTEQYVRSLRSAGCREADLPAFGKELELDDTYLARTSERLLAFGVLLVGGTWLQLRKGTPIPAERWIVRQTEQLLEMEYFRAVKTICLTVLSRSRGRLRRDTELAMQTMSWVARRELGELDEVRAEVHVWDTSGIDLRYAHAKAVLLEDDDLAVQQIAELLRRNDLTVVELCASPLYRQLLDRRPSDLLPEAKASRRLFLIRDENDQCVSRAVDEGPDR